MRSLCDPILSWGLGPQAPGICRLGARMVEFGGDQGRLRPFRLLSRRSDCIPAEPYPPLRYFQSGTHQPRRAILLHRTATTPLTLCLTLGVHFTVPLETLPPASTVEPSEILGIGSAFDRLAKLDPVHPPARNNLKCKPLDRASHRTTKKVSFFEINHFRTPNNIEKQPFFCHPRYHEGEGMTQTLRRYSYGLETPNRSQPT
jgi:hypothetical protein